MEDNIIFDTIKIFKTPEYKKLRKCTQQHCKKYEKILGIEAELFVRMGELIMFLRSDKAKNIGFQEILEKTLELTKVQKELVILNSNKENMLCAMQKCTEDLANIGLLKNQAVAKMISNNEKQILAAQKKLQQLRK